MSSHEKSLVVEFSFASLNGFSASMKEAIKLYLPEIEKMLGRVPRD